MLGEQVVRRIKRTAQVAFEKKAQYQEDIQLRTQYLIGQLRQNAQRYEQIKGILITSPDRLVEMRLGWRQEHFMGIHQQLMQRLSCYEEVPRRYPDVFNAMANPKVWSQFRQSNG